MSLAKLMQIGAIISDQPALSNWLAVCIRRCHEGEDFATAFDLKGQRAEAAAKEALVRAAREIDPTGSMKVDPLSKSLALEIRRFEQRVWARARNYASPNALNSLDAALWEAMLSWPKFPKSHRRLFDLLTQAGWHRQNSKCKDVNVLSTSPTEENTDE